LKLINRTLTIPFPDARLSSIALKAISVDPELSPLVDRTFSLGEDASLLTVVYRATTDRMLRVSVNGFMESLSTVLEVMAELDVDAVATLQKA
jgi:EKC/KEOPS complex subunit PCC1/LAGE3